MNIEVFYSKKTDDWRTPSSLYRRMMDLGYHDPCPYRSDKDGLSAEWESRNFVNPPYSKLREWVAKSIEQNKLGKEVIMLIPARTDTKAFKMLYKHGCRFTFITGRLKYNDEGTAPFPSMIVRLIGGGGF